MVWAREKAGKGRSVSDRWMAPNELIHVKELEKRGRDMARIAQFMLKSKWISCFENYLWIKNFWFSNWNWFKLFELQYQQWMSNSQVNTRICSLVDIYRVLYKSRLQCYLTWNGVRLKTISAMAAASMRLFIHILKMVSIISFDCLFFHESFTIFT